MPGNPRNGEDGVASGQRDDHPPLIANVRAPKNALGGRARGQRRPEGYQVPAACSSSCLPRQQLKSGPLGHILGGKGLKDSQVQTDEQEGQMANGKADELAASSISWAAESRL